MNQIIYKIFKGEKSSNVKIPIERDVFQFLDTPVFTVHSKTLPPELITRIGIISERYYDIHYNIIYHYLLSNLGIDSGDIEDLTVEDYGSDTITVHVYLDER
jgi:hypothetical protein